MNTSVGDSFAWAFRDPQWASKMLIQGLIAIIPIVGWIAMTGWLMMSFENARNGKNELPPAGFHLERGFPIFIVFFVYGLVLAIPSIVLYGIGGATAGANNGNNAAAAAGSGIFSLAGLVGFLTGLFLRFLIPSLIVNTYHGGLSGGFDIQRVWQFATLNVSNSVIAGLIVFVASIIGGLGFIVCCIGIIFTIPYENTITAAACAWFEKQHEAAATPPPAAAT